MAMLKNNWLRAGISLILLSIGIFMVKALEKPQKVKVVDMQEVWFEVSVIDEENEDEEDLSNYRIDGIAQNPPATGTNLFGCAQGNSTGRNCHVQLEFDEDEDAEELISKNVAAAMTQVSATKTAEAKDPTLP